MTTTAIPRPGAPAPAHDPIVDKHARAYILSLARGVKPSTRPDFGQWEHIIAPLEEKFDKYKGDIKRLGDLLANLREFNPSLDELLAPTIDEIIAQKAQEPPEPLFPPLPKEAQLPPKLSRGGCNLLDIYVAFSKKASPEGYEDFHPFIFMWLLSTIAARRVYLPMQVGKTYTNLMIALCADSTFFAKSVTAYTAISVLKEAELGFLMGPRKVTPQKLLSDMSGAWIQTDYEQLLPDKKERVKNRLAMASQKGMYFDEFGKFVRSIGKPTGPMSEFDSIFLELDACPDDYDPATISRGTEVIEKPYLTVLGPLTPNSIRSSAKPGSEYWGDGFFGRCSFVCAPSDEFKDECMDIGVLPIPPQITQPIIDWHNRLGVPKIDIIAGVDKNEKETGKFIITPVTSLEEHKCIMDKVAEDAWKRYRSATRTMARTKVPQDLKSNYGRLPTTALRMAILFASLENNNHIEMRHWAKAQELAELLRKNLHEFYRQVTATTFTTQKAALEDKIINHLKKHGALTINTLRKNHLPQYSTDELSTTLRSMERTKNVFPRVTAHSVYYSLIEETETGETGE